MNFDIDDYLTESDRKRIAEEVYRDALYAKIRDDKERIISNAAYQAVSKMCGEAIPDFQDLLIQNIKKVITQLSARTVFEAPDHWGSKGNTAWHMLSQITTEKRERIENRVNKIIDELSVQDCSIDIEWEVRQLLLKRLGWKYEDGE